MFKIMSKNYSAFLKLDTTKYKPGNYIIMVDGQVKRSVNPSRLVKTVEKLKAEYPTKTPFLAKIMPRGIMVL